MRVVPLSVLKHKSLLHARTDAATAEQIDALLETRRQLARQLLAPADPEDRERLKRIDKLGEEKERQERALAEKIPALKRQQSLELAPPADLADKLPQGAAFVDFFRYGRADKDPANPAVPCYAAFVLREGRPARRVELGEARPIDDALQTWRDAVAKNLAADDAAALLRKRLWSPLAEHLPTAADSTVYLAPDGPLSALPWAALPGREKDTVLLEDHLLVLVPYGPLLLDQLTRTDKPGAAAFLAVGDVAYNDRPRAVEQVERPVALAPDRAGGDKGWPDLPGTRPEVERIVELVRGRDGWPAPLVRRGAEAGTDQLRLDLPKARVAHLATHGFFAKPKEANSPVALNDSAFAWGVGGERRGAGLRNPLVQTGLVLAGANRPPSADVLHDDRGIMTAEAIAGLALDKLEVAVLSACETGLGEAAAGEGVFGLQRAFHVAGARNVVASLWRVDDAGTAVLMALFYENLLDGKQSPAAALRNAQLALYRTQVKIPPDALSRGDLFKDVITEVAKPPKEPQPGGGRSAPAKVWAAFILSGPGS
jgi:CHAT domain-containing protein